MTRSQMLRFLVFKEDAPKHRVMHNLHPVFLAFLSIGCFLAGTAGFEVLAEYGFAGFVFYSFTVLIVLLESLHYLFDR